MLIVDRPGSARDWAAHRYRLWSFLDMLKIYVPLLAQTIAHVSGVQSQLTLSLEIRKFPPGELSPELAENEAKRVAAGLVALGAQIEFLNMSPVIKAQLQRFIKILEQQPNYDPREIEILFRELQANFLKELDSACFLMIPSAQGEFYEQKEPPFGKKVVDKFPEAEFDIKAAGRCLALDEWTAAVFHLMVVLEVGLRDLNKGLRIKMTKRGKGIDYAQWSDLLTTIQSEIKSRRNPQQGKKLQPAMSRRLDWYEEMAAHFSNCNAAWRTHVSHGRGKYDQREADEVWGHVKSFMQLLAAGPS